MTRPDCTRLSFSLPGIDATGKPPAEFRIFALGTIATSKGDFLFDDSAALLCMEAYADHGNRLTIDYEHQALNDPPVQAPAAASFVPALRDDGIWAIDVHWTPRATEYLSNKEYLYFSPAFTTDEENRPTRILNVALTNLPATKNMQPLVAAKQGEQPMKTVLAALSLKDNANEAEALSAVNRMAGERAQLLTITGKDSAAEALAVLSGWKEAANEVIALRAEVVKTAEEQAARDFDAEITSAKKSSLLAVSDEHKRNKTALSYKGKPEALASLRAFLGALDPLVPVAGKQAGTEANAGTDAVVVLTAEERRLGRMFGNSDEVLIKNKARLLTAAKLPPVADTEDAA